MSADQNPTWSFLDCDFVVTHPSKGQYSVSGAGIGSINKTMATTRTVHDIASDGGVMVSKVPGDNGSVALSIQQVSPLNKWLTDLHNYLKDGNTPASEYALMTMTIRNRSLGETMTASGGSFEKEPDHPHQAQGQQRTWNMLFTDIQTTKA